MAFRCLWYYVKTTSQIGFSDKLKKKKKIKEQTNHQKECKIRKFKSP